MSQKGFSIVEMIIVMAIIGVLVAVATLNYSKMQQKASVDGQTRKLLAEITNVRVQALYTKNPRSIKLENNMMKVYPSDDTSVAPQSQVMFAYPIVTNFTDNTITFNTSGLVTTVGGSICIDPAGNLVKENAGSMDSLVVSKARINAGKRNKGAACAAEQINQQ